MQQLHDEHAAALWRFCLRLVPRPARAEDVVQETLLRAWRHRTILESPPPAVRAWLFTVARNIVIDEWRSRRARPETPVADVPERGRRRRDRPAAAVVGGRRGAHPALAGAPRGAAECYYRGRPVAEAARAARRPGGHGQVAHALRAARAAARAGGDGGGGMSCDFAHDDGAYVLGALSPAERPRSSGTCRAARSAPRGRASSRGCPGCSARVDPAVLEEPDADEPVPDTLLPAPGPRRYAARDAVARWSPPGWPRPPRPSWSRPAGGSGGRREPAAAGRAGVERRRRWPPRSGWCRSARCRSGPVDAGGRHLGHPAGPHLHLRPGVVRRRPAPRGDYALFVRTRDGRTEQVGSWRSLGGRTMRLSAGTAATPTRSRQSRCARRTAGVLELTG